MALQPSFDNGSSSVVQDSLKNEMECNEELNAMGSNNIIVTEEENENSTIVTLSEFPCDENLPSENEFVDTIRIVTLESVTQQVKDLNSVECMLLYLQLPKFLCSDGSAESNYKIQRNIAIKNSFLPLISNERLKVINAVLEEVNALPSHLDVETLFFNDVGVKCGNIFSNLKFEESIQSVIAWCIVNYKEETNCVVTKSDIQSSCSSYCIRANIPLMSTLLFGRLLLLLFPTVLVTKNFKGVSQYKNLCKIQNPVPMSEVNIDSIASKFTCKQIFNIYDQIISTNMKKYNKTQKSVDRLNQEQGSLTVSLNADDENGSYRSGELEGRTVIVHDPLSLLNLSANSKTAPNDNRKKFVSIKPKPPSVIISESSSQATQVVQKPTTSINDPLNMSIKSMVDIIGVEVGQIGDSVTINSLQEHLDLYKSKGKKFKEYKHPSVNDISAQYPKISLSSELTKLNLSPNIVMTETDIYSWYVQHFNNLQDKLSKMTSTQIPGKGMYKLFCGCCNVKFDVGEAYIRGLEILKTKLSELKIVKNGSYKIYTKRSPDDESDNQKSFVQNKKPVKVYNKNMLNNPFAVVVKSEPMDPLSTTASTTQSEVLRNTTFKSKVVPQVINNPKVLPQIVTAPPEFQQGSSKTMPKIVLKPQVVKNVIARSLCFSKGKSLSEPANESPMVNSYQVSSGSKKDSKPMTPLTKPRGRPGPKPFSLQLKKVKSSVATKKTTNNLPSSNKTVSNSLSPNKAMPKMMLLSDLLDSNDSQVKPWPNISQGSNKRSFHSTGIINKELMRIPSINARKSGGLINEQQHVSIQHLLDQYENIILPKTVENSDVAPVVVLNSKEVCDWYIERVNSLQELLKHPSHSGTRANITAAIPSTSKTALRRTSTTSASVNKNNCLSSRRSKARLMNFCEIDSDGEDYVRSTSMHASLSDKTATEYISQVTLKRARMETLDEHGIKKRKIFRELKRTDDESLVMNFIDMDDGQEYMCTFCSKQFFGNLQLQYHHKTHLTCKSCKKRLKNVDLMWSHLKRHCIENTHKSAPYLQLYRIDAGVNISVDSTTKLSTLAGNKEIPLTTPSSKNCSPGKSIKLKDLLNNTRNSGVKRLTGSLPARFVQTSLIRTTQTVSSPIYTKTVQQPSLTNMTFATVSVAPSSVIPISSQYMPSTTSLMQTPTIVNSSASNMMQISKPQTSFVAGKVQLHPVIQPQSSGVTGQLKNSINNNFNKIYLLNNIHGGQVVINNDNTYLVSSTPMSTSYTINPRNFNIVSTVPLSTAQLGNQPSGLQDHSYHQQVIPIQDENVDVVNKNNSAAPPPASNSEGGGFKLRVKSIHELR